jgi:hypothetical protein
MRKLGKLEPKADPRTLLLATYLPTPPVTPDAVGLHTRSILPWPMLGNDTVGDCTCAAALHWEKCMLALGGHEPTFTRAQAIAAYSAITGYDPARPSTDQGAAELDVLKYWRNTGIGGHKIEAFADCALGNEDHVRSALWLFEGLYIGIALPITAQNQKVWDVVETSSHDADPGSWGGHAVNVVAYDVESLIVVTWGQLQRMTWAFWHTYCDEAHAVLSAESLGPDGLAVACGFDLGQLRADLNAVVIG